MSSFKDIKIIYGGINPYGVLRFAMTLVTCSGRTIVDIAEVDYIAFTIEHFNEDNLDELKRKLTAMADFQDARTFIIEVDGCEAVKLGV